jgi:predicted DNA-binding protein YlxM (UPF0122 family)
MRLPIRPIRRSGLLTNIGYRPNAVAEIYRGKEVFGAVVRFYWKERRSGLRKQTRSADQSIEKTKGRLMMTMTRTVIDGVEFFVNIKTGEVGISISGLARLCGVSHVAITNLLKRLKSLVTKTPPKKAQTHTGYDKSLVTKTPKSVMSKTPSKEAKAQSGYDESLMNKTSFETENPKSQGGRPEMTEEDLPLCLKALLDYDFYLDVGNDYKNATILTERACIAIITYYAHEAKESNRTLPAQQTSAQFQLFGLRGWVHDITGWKAPQPVPHESLTHAEQLGIDPRYVDVQLDRHTIYNALLTKGINAQMYRVYLYLMDCDLVQHRPTLAEICKHTHVAKHNLYDMVERMRDYALVPEWLELDPSSRSLEAQIRDRLHAEYGGNIEVQTNYGPIDLLTATELIEIKRIEDWKTGFGQVLAKSPAYPQHGKRLHLFGNSDRTLRNVKACCREFEIVVSFEIGCLQAV